MSTPSITIPPAVRTLYDRLAAAEAEISLLRGNHDLLHKMVSYTPIMNGGLWNGNMDELKERLLHFRDRYNAYHNICARTGELLSSEEVTDEEWATLYADIKDALG